MSTDTIIITQPDTEEVSAYIATQTHGAVALRVHDQQSHELGSELLKELAFAERNVRDLFKPMKSAAFKAHREITGAEKKLLDQVTPARKEIGRKLATYENEQRLIAEEKAREEQKKLREEEEAAALVAAQDAEERGEPEEAEAILDAATSAPPPVVPPRPAVSKVAGVSSRETYKAEVTSPILLIKWILDNPSFIHLVKTFDQTALNQMARSQRDALRVPGVKVVRTVEKAVRL